MFVYNEVERRHTLITSPNEFPVPPWYSRVIIYEYLV